MFEKYQSMYIIYDSFINIILCIILNACTFNNNELINYNEVLY